MNQYHFDRIIVSSDDSCFLNFSPIVSKAWRSLFPGLKMTLAYVSNDPKHLDQLQELFDDVIIYKKIDGVHPANLAKIARRFACTQYEDQVCMIEDIDTAPLRSDYIINYAVQRKRGTLALVGAEVYHGNECRGKVPASNTMAESHVWGEILNPQKLSYENWVNSLKGMREFDQYEDPFSSPGQFSDESLMRALIKIHKINEDQVTHIKRNCDPHQDWIDRSWWSINMQKLQKNEYLLVNFMRPLDERAAPVIEHIFKFSNR